MSSDSTPSPTGPRLPRPYQLITMVDAKTLKAIKRRQGSGAAKLSRSEAVYQLLLAALAAEERAAIEAAAYGESDRRSGKDRRDPFVADAA